jgi:DNA-binding NtrC family response regulator
MAERRTVLMVDGDLGVLFVLAHELEQHGLTLIPSGSIQQARSILAKLKPTIDLLVLNCAVEEACVLATEMVRQNDSLDLIGIVSGNDNCDPCRPLFTFFLKQPQRRDARWIGRVIKVIQTRLPEKRTADE